MSGTGTDPTYVIEGREALTPVFDDLNRYQATTHFNAQITVELEGDQATGESHTMAHHLFAEDGERKIMIAAVPRPLRQDRSRLVLRRARAHPGLGRDPHIHTVNGGAHNARLPVTIARGRSLAIRRSRVDQQLSRRHGGRAKMRNHA
jgi:hypothetical protein